MFTTEFDVKIIDFDFAAQHAGRKGEGCLYGEYGVESYMAPEMLKGLPYSGEAIDIFSYGMMLLTLRTMKQPFEKASTQDEEYNALQTDQFWMKYSADLGLTDTFKQLIELLL